MENSVLKQEYVDVLYWAFEKALPLWASTGTDRKNGGFIEKLDHDGGVLEAPRRTRVVGRQVYSYATAVSLGWEGPGREIVDHGLEFLLTRCLKSDNTFHSEVFADGSVHKEAFDLYDHAFALFGLAAAARVRDDAESLARQARDIRVAMIRGWKNPSGGFEESVPRTLPLKANPHMHIFEASLAWIEVAPIEDDGWHSLADEIAELCLKKFLHPENGCLREFFDGEWNASADKIGTIVEPGHQFEWAWLLKRWGELRNRPDAIEAARRLVEIAETYGVDEMREVAFNEITDNFKVRDDSARLWPQTERIKAWLAMIDIAQTSAERTYAVERARNGLKGLKKYFGTAVTGLWFDKMNKDGTFVVEPAPASSLYHIMCAISELDSWAKHEDA